MCGVVAAGKTTLADALAMRIGAVRLSADVVHKELLGARPHERVPRDAHTDELAAKTYTTLGERAAAAGQAVVDATFWRRRYREIFIAALGSAPVFVECRASDRLLRGRLRARERDPGRVSNATLAVLNMQLAGFEPLDEIPTDRHVVVETDRPVRDVVATISATLGLVGSDR